MAECLVHRLRSSSLKDAVITPSSSSLTVYGGTGSNTVSFTYTGDGTVSASSSNTGAATVAVSGNNITVTYVAAGSATITISAPKTSKYKECSATVSVICERSTSTLSLSATSGTIYGGGSSGAYTYSYNGDGAVSASSSNTGVATVALSGNNISVSYVAPGSATVTVSAPQTAKYNAVSATIAITCSRTALTKPSLTQTSFSTTGNWCAPGYNNYDSNLMTVSGTTGTSSPGSYVIYFNLKDTNRYCWSDGSTGQVACGWSVSLGNITFYVDVYTWGRVSVTVPYKTTVAGLSHRWSNPGNLQIYFWDGNGSIIVYSYGKEQHDGNTHYLMHNGAVMKSAHELVPGRIYQDNRHCPWS